MHKFKLLGISIILALLLSSCSDEKSFEIVEPYSNHLSLFDLSNKVKSVSFEKQIFEISDGGYYPVDTNTNDIMASMDYPYSVDGLKYMGNLNNAIIFNYPITGNQYLLNELVLAEISSKNVKIEFEKEKIKKYSNIQDKYPYSITCEYDEKGRLISLDIQSNKWSTRKVLFQNKGNFLTQIIEQKKEKNDTINFVLEKSNDNLLKIKRNDKDILVSLVNNSEKKELEKIVYENDKTTIKFNNNKITETSKIKADGNYDNYKKLTYENGQIKTILSSDAYKKSTVSYNLNSDKNIKSINVATDEKRMSDLGLNFTYELNNKQDWTEMSYARDREIYDKAKRKVDYVKQQLLNYGYNELQAVFHKDYSDAQRNLIFTKKYCNKTTFKRNLNYVN